MRFQVALVASGLVVTAAALAVLAGQENPAPRVSPRRVAPPSLAARPVALLGGKAGPTARATEPAPRAAPLPTSPASEGRAAGLAAARPITERTRVLRGQVVAREDGRAIPGALVEASSGDWREAAQTDLVGAFVFETAPEGETCVRVSALGRRAEVRRTPALRPDELAFALETGARLRGRVVDIDGQPVAAAQVLAFSRPGPLDPQVAVSHRDGSFEITGLPPGAAVALVALTPRLATDLATVTWHVPSAALHSEELLVAHPRGALAVAGLPEGACELRPDDAPGELPQGVRPLEGGVRAARLVPGTYRLYRDGVPVSASVRVAPDETATLRCESTSAARVATVLLRVRAVDEARRSLVGAAVVVGSGPQDFTGVTDERGECLIGVPVGEVTVYAALAGHTLSAPVRANVNEEAAVEIELAAAR